MDFKNMSGYGVPGETVQMTQQREAKTLAQMQSNAPQILQARGAKPVVNTELLERVFDLQRSKGVEDGFCQLMLHEIISVSYTHLTLPTIYSV